MDDIAKIALRRADHAVIADTCCYGERLDDESVQNRLRRSAWKVRGRKGSHEGSRTPDLVPRFHGEDTIVRWNDDF